LLVAAGPTWTAYFDCGLRGTDAVSAIGVLSKKLQCQGLAIGVAPQTRAVPGVRPNRYGGVQFELFGPLSTMVSYTVRSVEAVNDGGRWKFYAIGTEQVFEEPEAYEARRVRDRFTSEMLERYCRALGVEVFDPGAYGPEAVLIESALPPAPAGKLMMSLEEAQELNGIVPGMADNLPG
jgi:hypothetical protein